MNRQRPKRQPRRGILLLLVLSMLAFLSILVVTYVAFSSRSRRSAYALASREFRAIEHDKIIDDALLTLLRGPRNDTDGSGGSPFFGEDMLADVYGLTDPLAVSVLDPAAMLDASGSTTTMRRPHSLGNQSSTAKVGKEFVRIPLDGTVLTDPAQGGDAVYKLDDALAGRILTVQAGPLANQSFRILRSVGDRNTADTPPPSPVEFLLKYSVVIELDPYLIVELGSGDRVAIGTLLDANPYAAAALFYAPGTDGQWGGGGGYAQAGSPNSDDQPYQVRFNGTPMNGGGIGVGPTAAGFIKTFPTEKGSFPTPVAFQPNIDYAPAASPPTGTNPQLEKLSSSGKSYYRGDADESYDAADFQNWFLSHRYVDENGVTRITPSFHRPALINYLVNQVDLSAASQVQVRALVGAIRRATLRPLPFADSQLAEDGVLAAGAPHYMPAHTRFTGGNASPAMRSPNEINLPNQVPRLHGLIEALVNGPWDVDNDGDGIPDSVWVDLGLPPVSSPEGKILRPLIAPLIEDMGGRINLNAHGNVAQLEPDPTATPHPQYGVNQSGPWGGTTTNQARYVFRGLGYGPAEIVLPGQPLSGDGSGAGATGTMHTASQLFTTAERTALLRERYRDPADAPGSFPNTPAPGRDGGNPAAMRNGGDDLDNLLHGTRPGVHTLQRLAQMGTNTQSGGWGMSIDPWGRGGLGIHRTGQLFASVSGTQLEPYDNSNTPVQPLLNESFNDPYEMDPTGRFTGDSPYTWAELEALLQNNPWVADELPARLRELIANSADANPELARMITARSVSLDLPTAMMTVDDRQTGSVALSRVLLKRLGITSGINGSVNAFVRQVVAPELRLGNKMDINRPFGNGVDDNSNGTIDEPEEVDPVDTAASPTDANAFPAAGTTSSYVASAFGGQTPNYDADEPATVADPSGRQLFARNLYILMMAMTGQGYDFPLESNAGGATLINEAAYKARRLAQWAVNVADYRDFDSIMTAFEFDTILSDGTWDVDGDLSTNDGAHRSVVWGVENPELVFSESTALHDVRVRDTENEQAGGTGKKKNDPTTPDDHTDSVRMPQGSLFMELYCPRARVNGDENHLAGAPHELYTLNNGQYQLDLARLAPPAVNNGPRMPVWRIAISEPHYNQVATQKSVWDPENLRAELPDTASFEPTQPDELGTDPPSGGATPPAKLVMERFIFMNALDTTDNGGTPSANEIAMNVPDIQPYEIFSSVATPPDPPFANGVDRLLEPSQYLLLAPRVTTNLGSFVYTSDTEPTGPSDQRFQVFTNSNPAVAPLVPAGNRIEGLAHFRRDNTATTVNTNANSRPALPLIIGAPRPTGWAATSLESGYVGLNVSEPMPNAPTGYYPEPTNRLDSSKPNEFPLTDAYLNYDDVNATAARNEPVDMVGSRPIAKVTADLAPGSADPFLGTVPQYCSAFLQRLADPTRPFHPQTNPYRTVDWMTIDLTIFSGEDDPTNVETNPSQYIAQSRQRSGQTGITGQTGALFSYETEPLAAPVNMVPAAGVAQSYFNFDFQQSLNYLNPGFGPAMTGAMNKDRGQPQTPFAMHPWLNRPFATAYELMMVPASSQGRLFEEFTLADTTESPYLPVPTGGNPYPAPDPAQFQASFGHLLNFFQSSKTEDDSAHFYRLFEFVGTKPPFNGEVELINPARTALIGSPTTLQAYSRNSFASLFQPPFNLLWDGRREGEINLNTLAGYPVWMGLMYGHLTDAERDNAPANLGTGDLNYGTFTAARRGYSPQGYAPIVDGSNNVRPRPYNYGTDRFSPDFPTEYAGAWRTGLDADLAPDLHGANGTPVDALQKPGIERSLARPDIDPSSLANQNHPAYVRPATADSWKNTQRSAAMRYQTLMRMPNLTTNQSHIFVVRLTLGYFEYDQATGLGREYKAELGQNERYKATFIIDRSIPVAYQPGSDTNVRNTVLFSRIED